MDFGLQCRWNVHQAVSQSTPAKKVVPPLSINSYPSPIERRYSPRVPYDSLAFVSGIAGGQVLHVRDISESGVFLYAKLRSLAHLENGTELAIELVDAPTPISFRAVVARQERGSLNASERFAFGIGLRICEIDDRNRELLEDALAGNERPRLELV